MSTHQLTGHPHRVVAGPAWIRFSGRNCRSCDVFGMARIRHLSCCNAFPSNSICCVWIPKDNRLRREIQNPKAKANKNTIDFTLPIQIDGRVRCTTYLWSSCPGGDNGITRQLQTAGAHAQLSTTTRHLLQLYTVALTFVQGDLLQIMITPRWIEDGFVLKVKMQK